MIKILYYENLFSLSLHFRYRIMIYVIEFCDEINDSTFIQMDSLIYIRRKDFAIMRRLNICPNCNKSKINCTFLLCYYRSARDRRGKEWIGFDGASGTASVDGKSLTCPSPASPINGKLMKVQYVQPRALFTSRYA